MLNIAPKNILLSKAILLQGRQSSDEQLLDTASSYRSTRGSLFTWRSLRTCSWGGCRRCTGRTGRPGCSARPKSSRRGSRRTSPRCAAWRHMGHTVRVQHRHNALSSSQPITFILKNEISIQKDFHLKQRVRFFLPIPRMQYNFNEQGLRVRAALGECLLTTQTLKL